MMQEIAIILYRTLKFIFQRWEELKIEITLVTYARIIFIINI